jgi:hypothetical protein
LGLQGCGLELRLGHLPAVLSRLPTLAHLTIQGELTSLQMLFGAGSRLVLGLTYQTSLMLVRFMDAVWQTASVLHVFDSCAVQQYAVLS